MIRVTFLRSMDVDVRHANNIDAMKADAPMQHRCLFSIISLSLQFYRLRVLFHSLFSSSFFFFYTEQLYVFSKKKNTNK